MTKTKVCKRKRVTIKLNSLIVNKMVQDILNKTHGTASYGQRFCFDDTAFNSLQEVAERFLENMWDQLVLLSHDNVVTVEHIHLWKRVTDFKPRFKKNTLSLCKINKRVITVKKADIELANARPTWA